MDHTGERAEIWVIGTLIQYYLIPQADVARHQVSNMVNHEIQTYYKQPLYLARSSIINPPTPRHIYLSLLR